MNRKVKLLLILIVLIGAGIALSYYIPFWLETRRTTEASSSLAALHRQARPTQTARQATETVPAETETPAPETAAPAAETEAPAESLTDSPAEEAPEATAAVPEATGNTAESRTEAQNGEAPAAATGEPAEITAVPGPTPKPTPDRTARSGPLPYPMKPKVTLNPDSILEELRDIYAINQDLVGWLTIPGTDIDYPVVQADSPEGMDYYLTHDFYGESNRNGALILDYECDPYTPSYNLIVSGHHLTNGMMFSYLTDFEKQSFWEKHRTVQFDTLMERQTYVIVAAFRSAAYKDNERGFRYSANIQYKLECEQWLKQVYENQLYDTGVDAEWGDLFLTLTTCNKIYHPEGRFVLVTRRLREGEDIDEDQP